jgi:hypothetical protein
MIDAPTGEDGGFSYGRELARFTVELCKSVIRWGVKQGRNAAWRRRLMMFKSELLRERPDIHRARTLVNLARREGFDGPELDEVAQRLEMIEDYERTRVASAQFDVEKKRGPRRKVSHKRAASVSKKKRAKVSKKKPATASKKKMKPSNRGKSRASSARSSSGSRGTSRGRGR